MCNAYFIPFSLFSIHHVLHRSMGQYICYLSKLFSIVTKKVVRLICRAKKTTLLVYSIVEIRTALIMYKANTKFTSEYTKVVYIVQVSICNQTKSHTLKKNYVYTNLKRMCISVKGVVLWNSLDSSLICCRNVHRLKKYTANILVIYVI